MIHACPELLSRTSRSICSLLYLKTRRNWTDMMGRGKKGREEGKGKKGVRRDWKEGIGKKGRERREGKEGKGKKGRGKKGLERREGKEGKG